MFLSIQFPLADCRAFLNEEIKLLDRPTWPSVSPDIDFVRSFGSIRRRRLGGVAGWLGENAICEAGRALRFAKIKNFRDKESSLSVPLTLAFRRFYSDGLGVGKFEVGLTTDPKDTPSLSRKQMSGFIKHCLELPVNIPALSDKAVSHELAGIAVSTILGQAAKPLSKFYAGCTMAHPPPVELRDEWVVPGAPVLFLVHGFSERIYLPFLGKSVPFNEDLGCDLSYCEVPHTGRNIRMWVMGLGPDRDYRDVRALRIYLLRLHAEHEVLRIVLQKVAARNIDVIPRSTQSNTLQFYLNEATRRISRIGSKANSLAEGDLAELARESEDLMNPGERDAVLALLKNIDVRRNILNKVADYTRTEIFVKEMYMDSKYKIGQVQGAVGDNAQAFDNVFNQWNQSGNNLTDLAKELATLRTELGKQAQEPEHFESAAAIARAETAAKNGDGPTVFEQLKNAGKWALDVAVSIGVPVAIDALKKAVGVG